MNLSTTSKRTVKLMIIMTVYDMTALITSWLQCSHEENSFRYSCTFLTPTPLPLNPPLTAKTSPLPSPGSVIFRHNDFNAKSYMRKMTDKQFGVILYIYLSPTCQLIQKQQNQNKHNTEHLEPTQKTAITAHTQHEKFKIITTYIYKIIIHEP